MFKSMLPIAFIASTALAQSASIGLPAAGTVLTSGADYIFQIQESDAQTSVQDVAIVIGLQQCQNDDCSAVDESLGTVLYSGSFQPQFHEANLPAYQNFSVQMPVVTSSTPCLVGVAHFALVGDGNAPLIDYHNQSVTLE